MSAWKWHKYPRLTYCKVKPSKADGSGYMPNRLYGFAGIVTGKVEITDTVTHKVTYEDNETFGRCFEEVQP